MNARPGSCYGPPACGPLALSLLVLAACNAAEPESESWTHPTEMALPDPSFEAPDPEELQLRLDNGLVAYIAEDHTAPMVTLSAVVSAGTADDVREGAAQALATALRTRGPSTMTRGDFLAALDRMVAEFSVEQSPEETVISLDVPTEDWREALVLLADLVRRPAVSSAEVARWSGQISSASTRVSAGGGAYEGSLASAVSLFAEHLTRGHPFSTEVDASAARALTPPAALAYHRRHFTPAGVTLAVGGDISRANAEQAVTAEFGDWASPATPAAPTDYPELRADDSPVVWTYPVDKLQAWVVMGHELPPVPDEDRAALEVMNYILGGGHFDTRLFRATRDRRGLTNDDSGFLEPGIRGPGRYTFRTYGRPEVVRLLLHLTIGEIHRIRDEPVTEEELFVAKGALADGEFSLRFRTGAATARTYATEWSRYGSHERTAGYRNRMLGVTAEDVQQAARRYLDPDRLDIVIVGPIDQIREAPILEDEGALSSFGTVVDGR